MVHAFTTADEQPLWIRHKDAVRNGLTWSINNGVVEGRVHRLKLSKRRDYGRASFPLLRQRVLSQAVEALASTRCVLHLKEGG
jgi:hypothetical protein